MYHIASSMHIFERHDFHGFYFRLVTYKSFFLETTLANLLVQLQGPASSGKSANYIANYALLYLTLASNDAGLAVDVASA